MELLDLPSEILCEIISLCEPGAVTQTCRTFNDIAVSTPALWTSVRLDPLQCVPEGEEHLYRRLCRTADLPLTVSVGPVQEGDSDIVMGLCTILSVWSAQIGHLYVHTTKVEYAGLILKKIFHDSHASVFFFALQSLSVHLDKSQLNCFGCLDLLCDLLAHSDLYFPRLQSLSIPSFCDCISFKDHRPFRHLHTLVLEGILQEFRTPIVRVLELLSNTPQLQTLWLKQDRKLQDIKVLDPLPNRQAKYADSFPFHITLPHLVRLAVSAPGIGTELLYCLEAPSLEDLHLDDSYPGPTYNFSEEVSTQGALRSFASRSSGLRRLAFTQASLAQRDFEWLLFGDGGRPPFPQLETLAFHGYSEQCDSDFDDDLLLRFAQQPTIPLHRLVFLQCALSFKGSTLIQVYQRVIANAPNEKYELEIDCPCGQITDENLDTLEEIGVHLTRRYGEAKMDKWWTLGAGHEIDASDSYAY